MKYIFVGGSGRSGTSFFANSLASHDEICTFKDVELKIFCEVDGLLDLYQSIVTNYTPNRGEVCIARFEKMFKNVLSNFYGQKQLDEYANKEHWNEILLSFIRSLETKNIVKMQTKELFFNKVKIFINKIALTAASLKETGIAPKYFLEKTPHDLLQLVFIKDIFPDSYFMHIIRDPRSVAFSLLKMSWGPSKIEQSCEWVDAYFEAWHTVKAKVYLEDIKIKEFFIEDIANQPKENAKIVSGFLDIKLNLNLFDKANYEYLNKWSTKIDSSQMEYLNSNLSRWVEYFNYDLKEVGKRLII